MTAPTDQWAIDCQEYRGELLTGTHKHWCFDWDGLPCDETCYEWPCCPNARERHAEDILLGGPGWRTGEDRFLARNTAWVHAPTVNVEYELTELIRVIEWDKGRTAIVADGPDGRTVRRVPAERDIEGS